MSSLAGYIGEFELVDDHRAGKIVVELNGRLNKCGVISPRYNVGVGELEAWTARLLPSRQVCVPQFPVVGESRVFLKHHLLKCWVWSIRFLVTFIRNDQALILLKRISCYRCF